MSDRTGRIIIGIVSILAWVLATGIYYILREVALTIGIGTIVTNATVATCIILLTVFLVLLNVNQTFGRLLVKGEK